MESAAVMPKGVWIDLGPFKQRYEELRRLGELDGIAHLAEIIGWQRHGRPDVNRARRVLGMDTRASSKQRISYENAVILAPALNADPVDLGF